MSIYSLVPYFPHPSNPSLSVCVILDVPHLIKLVRNSWQTFGTIVWKGKGKGEWKYVELLHEVLETHGLRLTNKITRDHIFFHNRKMKVYLGPYTQLNVS